MHEQFPPGTLVLCFHTERTAYLTKGNIYEVAPPLPPRDFHPQVYGHDRMRVDMRYGTFRKLRNRERTRMSADVLHIFSFGEDGLNHEIIRRSEFDEWVQRHTDGVRPECQPRFIDRIPDSRCESNVYCVLEAKVIVPMPIKTVITYKLD